MSMIGWPAILKSRTLGYDGKGQSLLKSADDLKPAWELLAGVPAIVEAFVPFNREVSIIAARNVSGAIVFYPLSENCHRGGILRVSECCDNDPMQQQAEVLHITPNGSTGLCWCVGLGIIRNRRKTDCQ